MMATQALARVNQSFDDSRVKMIDHTAEKVNQSLDITNFNTVNPLV